VIDDKIINACRKSQREAQRTLYEQLAPMLHKTCLRYLKKPEEAEEALADAFFTIFTKISQLKENYALEAWARKITVNYCLAYLKKRTNFNLYLEDVSLAVQPFSGEETTLEEADLLQLLDYIPAGCKTIFNLFVIEGFGHKEIAEMLNISEGTSKSQLNAAKTKLKELVNQLYFQKQQQS
jgi:RNA polymerase sigma factor (sigma-70 family)